MTAMTRPPAYPLRLPASIKAEAERLAALRTASYFAERKGRANWDAFDRLMARSSGEPPRPGDEMPAGS